MKKRHPYQKNRFIFIQTDLKKNDCICISDLNMNFAKKIFETGLNYDNIKGLRIEAMQKLGKIKPESIGQASRISGVSPADMSVLMIYIEHSCS